MMKPARFPLAIAAPFPHPLVPHEGWMSRIASIDDQLRGIPRIYLNFSEGHDDSRCRETRHDPERAEALLHPSGKNSAAFVSNLMEAADALYVHTLHLAEYVLPWLDTGKVYVDIHGITPEEEALLGRGCLKERYEAVEREVLERARCCICVSRAMKDHYEAKYPSIMPDWLTIPIAALFPPDSEAAHERLADGRRATALYSGGAQAWQNLDAMLDLAEAAGEEVDFRFLSHDHALIRRRIDALGMARPPTVGYCEKTALPAAYRAAEFGLVLRDDSPVNRVSCPTKLVEYLRFGLIPVVRTPHLGDFARLGFAYVTEEEFKDGFIPDAASRDWMAERNRHVAEQLTRRFHTGTRQLRAMVSAPAPASRERVATRHFHDVRHFRRCVLDRHADFPCRLLEVGAFSTPTVDPADADVKFLDFHTTEELRAMARENGADPASVVPVDYVCRTDDYAEVVDATFDVLVAAHVLEHVDHAIAWLRTVRTLIRDGGLLFLVLPDKKKSFDRFRPDTPLSHLLFEHLAPEQDVSSIHNFETVLYYDETYIEGENDPASKLDVKRLARGVASSHPGVHRHVFQFETFGERILKPLLYTGLLDFTLLETWNCPRFGEFAIVLRAGRDEAAAPDPGGLFGPAPDSLPYLDAARTPGE